VLAVGGAAAAAVVAGVGRRRGLLLALAAPLIAVGALIGLDLILGGGAHLTRSVLDAGGLSELGDVMERRLRLSARSFVRPSNARLLVVALILLGTGFAFRRQILAWFEGRRAALAALAGTGAATAVGTLANDSGALLLMIGTAFLVLLVGYAWAQAQWPGSAPQDFTSVKQARNTPAAPG
jgi:hypothetical protein